MGLTGRRVWRKLHLAADNAAHGIICADLSLNGTTDAQTLPVLMIYRIIKKTSADGAYDTGDCHDALLRKKIRPLIPSRSGAQHWSAKYHERNHAVANQHLSLRDYDAQVGEAMAMVKAFNRMTLLGMPDSVRIA